jgi:hypothetical protein
VIANPTEGLDEWAEVKLTKTTMHSRLTILAKQLKQRQQRRGKSEGKMLRQITTFEKMMGQTTELHLAAELVTA